MIVGRSKMKLNIFGKKPVKEMPESRRVVKVNDLGASLEKVLDCMTQKSVVGLPLGEHVKQTITDYRGFLDIRYLGHYQFTSSKLEELHTALGEYLGNLRKFNEQNYGNFPEL